MQLAKFAGSVAVGIAALSMTATAAYAGDSDLAQPAHSASSSYKYPGGDVLQANVWIQSLSDSSGCGDWQTSAKLLGNNPSNAEWIKNRASFSATGIGASLSGSGGGTSTSNGGAQFGREWTNYNNWISDLAGNVCANWLTIYVSATSEATSYVPKYGSPRSAIASV